MSKKILYIQQIIHCKVQFTIRLLHHLVVVDANLY
jgi:hypothetical protein